MVQACRRPRESVDPRYSFSSSEYRRTPSEFSLAYHRETASKIPARVEKEIEKEPMGERNLVGDSTVPIASYNYSALRDQLAKQ